PLRAARLTCGEVAVENAAIRLDGRADERLTSVEGELGLRTGALSYGDARLAALAGTGRASWRDGGLTATYDLAGTDLATAEALVARFGLDGSLRTRRSFERIELDTRIDGEGVRPGVALERGLADAVQASEGSLFAPVLERIRRQLAVEG